MRIVTWNCGGALRRKRTALVSLDADVLVIQECENPALSADQSYCDWAGQQRALWVGRSKDKGLGVFARPGLSLEAVALDDAGLQLFLPCRIEGMSLLAVWTKKSDSDTYNYIGQLWLWLQRHAGFLAGARSTAGGRSEQQHYLGSKASG